MGNKLGRRRQVVEDKYTRPQGLYQHKDVDHKKLRKLILDSKLAPCYPGDEESTNDFEECPICFLFYPSLNRSRCCTKGICTECFLQMKNPNSTRPTQCPYCKTANYAVEYRGVKTKEEKGMEQIGFDLDLEDIMVMEAIWLSIQDNNGRHRNPLYGDTTTAEQYVTEEHYVVPAMAPQVESSSSPSGGLACAIAALAERQQMGGESSTNYNGNMPAFNMPPGSSRFSNRVEQYPENYPPIESSMNALPDGGLAVTKDDGEWGVDRVSEVAEAGTSYASSDATDEAGGVAALPPTDEAEGSFQNVGGPIVPESFEEQMMLAMAVSLAEARARTSTQGVSWQ
ncbi:hypothetical protein PVL29_026128 [Vitis rotundifolia]|uniref:RING-type domain-containing protein n=1 Tax=Vitis rotundifolia TaxID=103349 RepID=A0AA38YLR4_VITRO|nr:hypothetical protein PVL29_026128 [Vitis rotundifolia]